MLSRFRHLLPTVLAASLMLSAVGASGGLVLDEKFDPPHLATEYPPSRVLQLGDGRFLRFFGTNTLTRQLTGAITRYLPDGALDLSFSFSREFYDVTAAAEAADGKIIIAARRYEYYGAEVSEHLLRLNDDGSIDSAFTPVLVGYGGWSTVRKIVVQTDGAILVGGYFDTFAGTARRGLVRLRANGTVDETFNPPLMPEGSSVWAIVPMADGRIVFSGYFTALNGAASIGVARVHGDGSIDASFQPAGLRRINNIRGIIIQHDGKIVVGGPFERTSYPVTRYSLIRLHPSGELDPSFADPVAGRGYLVYDLLAQPDGKLIAAYASRVWRLNSDGSEDRSFAAPWASSTPLSGQGTIYSVNVSPEGKVLFGGFFNAVNGDASHFGVAEVNGSGQVEALPGLTTKPGSTAFATSFARLDDGRTFVTAGGPYYQLDPRVPHNFLCLRPDGSADALTLSSTARGSILAQRFLARDFTRLADGAFFVAGLTWGEYGSFEPAAGKFHHDGAEDPIFRYDAELGSFESAAPAADGGVLLAGEHDVHSTIDMKVLSRLRPSGRLDVTFRVDPRIGDAQIQRPNSWSPINKLHVGSRILAVQPDGKILFVFFSSDRLWHLVRLHPGGMIDSTFSETTFDAPDVTVSHPMIFDPQTGVTWQPPDGVWTASLPLLDAELMSDGRIIVAGRFTSFGGTTAAGLVRLLPDGTRDHTFEIGAGAQWTETAPTERFWPVVERVQLQTDGRLLIAGTFEAFNGMPAPGIASLHPDGSVDTSLPELARRLQHVSGATRLKRQPDGSFLLSGPYAAAGESEARLIRIDSRGGVPVVGSPTVATAVIGRAFSYQIVASGEPTSFGATGLPTGFSVDPANGLITGTASAGQAGVYDVTLTATNTDGTSAPRKLLLSIPALPRITAAASEKWHYAAKWAIDVPLTGAPAVECRRVSGDVHDLVLTFNNEMISAKATVSAGYASSVVFADEANKVTTRLSGIANGQKITVTIDGVDSYGQTLSGAQVQLGFLLGDSNGDGVVNSGDALQTRNRSGQPLSPTNFRCDFNTDGVINSGDAVLVRNQSGTALP